MMHSTKTIKLFFTLCLFALPAFHSCLAGSNTILDQLLYESYSQSMHGNYMGAFRVNTLALYMAEEKKSIYFSYFGSIYQDRFNLHRKMKQYDEAYTAALRAKEIFSSDPEKEGCYYSALLMELADMLVEQGKYKEAEKFALASVENMESKGSSNPDQLPRIYRALGNLYAKQRKLEQAVPPLKKSIIFAEKWGEDGSMQKLESLTELNKVYLALGQADLAEQVSQQKRKLKIKQQFFQVASPSKAGQYLPATLIGRPCSLPQYPAEALQKAMHGTAKFRFLIDETGEISAKYIAISSGFHLLDATTLQAFSKCTFSPAKDSGKATQSWYSGQFVWTLPD